jgi:hypothetical protein
MRLLKRADLLTEDPRYPGNYRYNYDCKHIDRQAELEKILL